MLAFVSITHSITIFPAPFLTAIEMLSLCTSMPIYFLLSIEGVPFCRGFEPNTQNPTPKGAPFYIVSAYRQLAFGRCPSRLSEYSSGIPITEFGLSNGRFPLKCRHGRWTQRYEGDDY